MKNDIRLLIVGGKRSGKDTMAEILRDEFNLSFKSSSEACAEIFMYDELKAKYGYKTFEECYEDRVNRRAEWFERICWYNQDDKARLAKDILKTNNTYVGMRSSVEIAECRKQGLFDLVIWVDALGRVEQEGKDSFDIVKEDADIIVENNGTREEFVDKVKRLGRFLKINLAD